ncbi:MAG TPA: hypothetical protein PKD72_07240 [Gemmatales bacterium]|nr:hypothetical protein [Gemmatales bacterium]
MQLPRELRGNRGWQGCLVCLKPAVFMGTIAKGLTLALATSADSQHGFIFRNREGVPQVIMELNGHTLIEWDH